MDGWRGPCAGAAAFAFLSLAGMACSITPQQDVCSAADASVAEDGGLSCPPGDVLWQDFIGGPSRDGGPSPLTPHGDLRCYHRCQDDGDCGGSCRSHCAKLGLFGGTDYVCNSTVLVCRPPDAGDCPPP